MAHFGRRFTPLVWSWVLAATGGAAGPDLAADSRPHPAHHATQTRRQLDDPAWQGVPALTDFAQVEPVSGAAPCERIEVRFA